MKILLDECLPLDFRHSFVGHEAHSANWAGFKGLQDAALLRAAEFAGYDVLLTVDQGLPYQQVLDQRRLAIVIVRAKTNQLRDLIPLVPSILRMLVALQPGEVITAS